MSETRLRYYTKIGTCPICLHPDNAGHVCLANIEADLSAARRRVRMLGRRLEKATLSPNEPPEEITHLRFIEVLFEYGYPEEASYQVWQTRPTNLKLTHAHVDAIARENISNGWLEAWHERRTAEQVLG